MDTANEGQRVYEAIAEGPGWNDRRICSTAEEAQRQLGLMRAEVVEDGYEPICGWDHEYARDGEVRLWIRDHVLWVAA